VCPADAGQTQQLHTIAVLGFNSKSVLCLKFLANPTIFVFFVRNSCVAAKRYQQAYRSGETITF